MAPSKPKSCQDYALYYIYRYPKTEKELRTQLMKKGYFLAEIDTTITYLKGKGYIDDRQFVELYLNSEVIKKGKPLLLIKQKLLAKGVDKHILEDAITIHDEQIIHGMVEKIVREIDKFAAKDLDPVVIIQKLLAKGYKLDDVKKALRKRKGE